METVKLTIMSALATLGATWRCAASATVCLLLALGAPSTHAQEAGQQFTPATGAYSAAKLRIVTIERRPFMFKSKTGFTGFSAELWAEIARELGRRYEMTAVQTFPQMLQAVVERKADIAIANITITAAREATMDFSQPMFDAGLRVMVVDEGRSVTLIGALFNLEMLGLLLLAAFLLFVCANLMWYFERDRQPYFQHPYKEGLWRSFWWALNVTVNGGFEERVPQSTRGRVFAVFLVVASLFIVSAFVAKITATLTVGQLQSQITSYRDLYGRRVGTTRGSTAAAFLQSHSLNAIAYDNIDAMFTALVKGRIDAIVHDAPILQYYASTRGRGRVRVVGEMLKPEKYGIALPQSSELAEPINRALLKLREDGTFERLRSRWFD